ncbi:3-dehydroquinate synthase [Luteolibacter algae]|uniref:3-dehydroquinate synthase n=1 Tax=Luteolibacter algae TaxID=454151 RepID=A0ABW5D3P3_9BACT
MDRHDFDIPITFKHRVIFTHGAFTATNSSLADVLDEGGGRRVLVFLEDAVASLWKNLVDDIHGYFAERNFEFRGVKIFEGGESCKADDGLVRKVWGEIDAGHIDRHSYVIVIGGGAFLDAVGFAVSTAHRGVRLLRFPTTTLSQDDSGVGVKSAINAFGKKNWVGSFSVPFAVINDFNFLESQNEESSVAGLIEAVKVALVKDGEFFEWIEKNVEALANLERGAFEECVKRSALLHARHIAMGGDPFETGSSRPLDFGHWAAHKIEALTNYQVSHAEAVAVGLALDTVYSSKKGFLSMEKAARILNVLEGLDLKVYHPALDWTEEDGSRRVLAGLDEFREHLGGELTVLLLKDLGHGMDVHEFDMELLNESISELSALWDGAEIG